MHACLGEGRSFDDCSQQVMGQQSQAIVGKDVEGFNRGGGAPLPRALAGIDAKGLYERLKSGGARSIGAIAAPLVGAELGASMSRIAELAEKNSDKFASVLGTGDVAGAIASVAGSLPSSKDGNGSGQASTNPFAALLGSPAKAGGTSAGGLRFGGAGASAVAFDIYHARSSHSLFEIVTGKIESVRERVGLEAGEPAKPKTRLRRS